MPSVRGWYNIRPLAGNIKLNNVATTMAGVTIDNVDLWNYGTNNPDFSASQFTNGAINLSGLGLAYNEYRDFVMTTGYRFRIRNAAQYSGYYTAEISLLDSNLNVVSDDGTNALYYVDVITDGSKTVYLTIGDCTNTGTSTTYRNIIFIYYGQYQKYCDIQRPYTVFSEALGAPIVPTYNWQPFAHLAGNSGQFQMDLSTLDASIIGDGETANSTSDHTKYTISSQSSIYNMLVNVLDNQETTVAYCGDNYMTVTRRYVAGTAVNLIYFTLKFYFRSGTLIYTSPEFDVDADHSNDRLLSIIYDTTHQVAALDLITTLSGTDGIFYNNSALPNDTVLSAMYIWLQDNGVVHTGPYDTGTTDDAVILQPYIHCR